MSYFMTLGGEPPNVPAEVELVRISSSQPYLESLESELTELVGRRAFLLHDKETGTSDIVVSDLVSALQDGLDVRRLAVAVVMESCFSNAIPFRIWWAGGDDNARIRANNLRKVESLSAALDELTCGRGVVASWQGHAENTQDNSK